MKVNLRQQILRRFENGSIPEAVILGEQGTSTFYGSVDGRPLPVTVKRAVEHGDMHVKVFRPGQPEITSEASISFRPKDDIQATRREFADTLHGLAAEVCE